MRLIALVIAMGLPIASVVAEEGKPTPEEVRESKIYEALADMIVLRDETQKKYVLLMHGEEMVDSPNHELLVRPSVIVKLVDQSRQFDLTVRLQYVGQPPYYETTSSYLYHRGREKSFVPGIASVGSAWVVKPLTPKPASKRKPWEMASFFDQHGNFACPGCPPIDSYLVPDCAIGSVKPGGRSLESVVVGQYELESSKPAVSGVMETDWLWETRWGATYDVKIHFSAAYDMLPVRMKAVSRAGDRFYASRIEWRKQKNRLLPYRVRFASKTNLPNISGTGQYCYRCFWLVGDDVPNELFETENQILAVLDHFEIPHSVVVGDNVVPCELTTPDDLYTDDGTSRK